MSPNFPGLTAAVHTPFDSSGALKVQTVPAQASFLAGRGILGVFVGGTTGEWPSLTVTERMHLADAWSTAGSQNGLKVIIHAGHSALEDARALAGHAASLGVDAISTLSPSFLKPSSLGALVDWCAQVAEPAASLPFFYYHIPVLTGLSFPMADFLPLASEEIPNFAGIKFTSTDFNDLEACVNLAMEDVEILFGVDEEILRGLQAGCRGAVGSSYNFASPLHLALIEAHESGALDEAGRLQKLGVQAIEALQKAGYLPAAKQLMGRMGVEIGSARPPLVPVSEAAMDEAEEILRGLGHPDWGGGTS